MDLAASVTRQLARVVSPTGGGGSKQVYFLAFVAVFTLVISFSSPVFVQSGPYLAGLILLALITVAAFAVPWNRLPSWCGAIIPVLDIVAVGLFRDVLRTEASAVSLLTIIPAIWLVARLRIPGAVIATLCVTAAIAGPALVRSAPDINSTDIARALLLPFTVLQVGLLAAGTLKVLDGQARRMTATLQEKEELLEATATWERLLENILDSVPVGIVVVDRDGHDVLMNRAQKAFHEDCSPSDIHSPEESQLLLRYPGTATAIPPDQRPVRRAVLQESFSNYVISTGPPGQVGTKFSTSARQILDRHGNRDGAVVVFSDVSSYVDAVRAQQQFVAAVSHELRTPLTSVIGYLELAMDDEELPEGTAGYLTVANRNAEQLLTLVQDLLHDQVARSTVDGLELRPHRVSGIAQEALESAAPQAEKRGISLSGEIEESPVMLVDAKRLTQAISNLLSNALKYTPRGGSIQVHCRLVDGAVEVSIIDSGIGMSDQEQTNLFTEYYRTETARKSPIPGHGIGLALTRALVLAHGGQISVRSTPGTGSTFTIRLSVDRVSTS